MVFVCLCLSYFTWTMPSGYIHADASARFHAFLWLSNIPVITYNHIFFIHSSSHGHFHCFFFLAVVNNAETNMWMQISFQVSDFVFKIIPRSGIAGPDGSAIFNF